MVVKDKVLVGVSGGEFGVRAWVTAYDLKTGKLVWRGYSEGPDSDTLIDPDKTTALGKPVGKDSSTRTWQGDQWKIGGGATWGWYSYDPELNLMYYGSGNPSTWNPKQRPGDNRWSMTIWARDVDTGVAKWVYQMTPHDEWDYDGINEMILTDQKIDGKERKLLTHFDRNGFGYTLDRTAGELLVAEKFDPEVNWATGVDMDKSSPNYGRPKGVAQIFDGVQRRGRQLQGHLPGGVSATRTSSRRPIRRDRALLCADQPRLHGLRAVQGQLHRRSALRRRDAVHVSASRRDQHGQLHRLGRQDRQDRLVGSRAVLGLVGRSGDRRRRVFYGTLEGYLKAVDAKTGKELYKFKTPSGIIGNVMTYEHGGRQYRRGHVRRRRLGGHRPRGRLDEADGRSGRGRRLCGAVELHRARRSAHGVRSAERIID